MDAKFDPGFLILDAGSVQETGARSQEKIAARFNESGWAACHFQLFFSKYWSEAAQSFCLLSPVS
jgi:hypothetical protein